MTGKHWFYQSIVLIGLSALLVACNPARSASTPAQPDLPAGETSARPAPTSMEQPATMTPTPTSAPQPVETRPAAQGTPAAPTAPPAPPQPAPPSFPPSIGLEAAFSGFESPVYVTHAGEQEVGTSRLFVVEKAGRIRLIKDGDVLPVPFLDISDRVGAQ